MNKIPLEVALMLKVAGGPESFGKSSAVSLLDWYYLDHTLILVMERPVPSMDLFKYLKSKGGRMEEHMAKVLKLGGRCLHVCMCVCRPPEEKFRLCWLLLRAERLVKTAGVLLFCIVWSLICKLPITEISVYKALARILEILRSKVKKCPVQR